MKLGHNSRNCKKIHFITKNRTSLLYSNIDIKISNSKIINFMSQKINRRNFATYMA